jgi:hypothetical protein
MSILSTLSSWISKIGQSIQFVAFWAHFGVAALIVEHTPHHLLTAVAISALAVVKEFYYDAKYETNPPQTFLDNFEDLLGWVLGAVVGLLLVTAH